MKTRFVNKVRLITALVIIFLLVFTLIPGNTVLAQGDPRAGGGTPTLLTPHGTIITTTPKFNWTVIPTATKYHYQLWKGSTVILNKYPGTGICGTTYCSANPLFALQTGVTYKWRVRAYVGAWNAWSVFMTFYVSPPGFDSQFTGGNMDGWARRAGGTWYFVDNNWLVTKGQLYKFTSLYQTRGQYTDFDYSISIFRANSSNPNWIMVRTGPLIIKSDLEWGPGYMFGFTNEGDFRIWLSKSDGSHVNITSGWIDAPSYKINQWNTFRVKAVGINFWYYINGTLVYSFKDSTYSKGFVGLQTTMLSSSEGAVYVDWAKLAVIPTGR